MTTIKDSDVLQDPLAWLRRVRGGETLLVTANGDAIAEIRPVSPTSKESRPLGLCLGEFTVPEDFDAPLPEEVLREFEGG
jgi:antitoxin (DNA-binding transcriptional repressor) of toxin-antitoxin stability system